LSRDAPSFLSCDLGRALDLAPIHIVKPYNVVFL